MTELTVVLPGELAVGPRPTAGAFETLRQMGVTAILCLQEEEESPRPSPAVLGGLRWARVPVADGHLGGAMQLGQLRRAVRKIQGWREAGEMVYVHCYAGVGRSPTVCAAYLAAAYGLPLGEALQRVRTARPAASPTAQQLVVLAQYLTELSRCP